MCESVFNFEMVLFSSILDYCKYVQYYCQGFGVGLRIIDFNFRQSTDIRLQLRLHGPVLKGSYKSLVII